MWFYLDTRHTFRCGMTAQGGDQKKMANTLTDEVNSKELEKIRRDLERIAWEKLIRQLYRDQGIVSKGDAGILIVQ